MRLDGRVGVVTAAGSGMGRAGALRFAGEGASVGVVDVNAEAVERVVTEIVKAGGQRGSSPTCGRMTTPAASSTRPPTLLAASTSCGTMSAIPVRRRWKGWIGRLTSWPWTSTCAR